MRLLVALLSALALSNAQPKNAAWKMLFDGRSLAGWDDPARKSPPGDSWTVEDGCIKARANPHIREDLLTLATVRDFELEFEWKISPGGNSGVKYLIQDRVFLERGKARPGTKRFEDTVAFELPNKVADRSKKSAHGEDYPISFEFQVIDDRKNVDAARGTVYQAGSLYSLVAPKCAVVRPVGVFNRSRVVLRGTRVEHWLNGVKVIDVSLDSDEVKHGLEKRWTKTSPVYDLLARRPRRDCPIGLQNHGDDAWFRNIRIRPVL
jgi:hypothetical protein